MVSSWYIIHFIFNAPHPRPHPSVMWGYMCVMKDWFTECVHDWEIWYRMIACMILERPYLWYKWEWMSRCIKASPVYRLHSIVSWLSIWMEILLFHLYISTLWTSCFNTRDWCVTFHWDVTMHFAFRGMIWTLYQGWDVKRNSLPLIWLSQSGLKLGQKQFYGKQQPYCYISKWEIHQVHHHRHE